MNLNCKYCGSLRKNKNSLSQHEIRCHSNPNRLIKIAWNKGLSVETDERVKKNTESQIKTNNERISGIYKEYEFICEKCDKPFLIKLTEIKYKNKVSFFCSQSCANKKKKTTEQKKVISNKLSIYYKNNPNSLEDRIIRAKKIRRTRGLSKEIASVLYWNTCKDCNNFSLARIKSERCRKCGSKLGGKISSEKQKKRSKKEIELFNYLNELYYCKHNERTFNGWDADIIIDELKLAILWNGPWHYKTMFGKHSLKQVKNRDDIKLKEINKMNWKHISVKDFKNNMSSEKAFSIIIDCIKNKKYNISIQ